MKKRALSAIMASAMVWSTFATSAFAGGIYDFTPVNGADPTTATETVTGTVAGVGTVDTKEHRQHFRVALPTDKAQVYEYWVDPSENGNVSSWVIKEITDRINGQRAAITATVTAANPAATADEITELVNQEIQDRIDAEIDTKVQTVYFKRWRDQRWLGQELPFDETDTIAPTTYQPAVQWTSELLDLGYPSYVLSNRSNYMAVTNIGSCDVVVTANLYTKTANDDSHLDVRLNAYAYNSSTAAQANGVLSRYNGWLPIRSNEKEVIPTGVDAIIGEISESGPESKVDVWMSNTGYDVINKNETYETTNQAGASGNFEGWISLNELQGIDLNADRTSITVRLVREGGNPVPAPTVASTANQVSWRVSDEGTYLDDATQNINLSTLTAANFAKLNSVALQVEADAYGAGWTQNQKSKITMIWTISSEKAAAPTFEQIKHVVEFDNGGVPKDVVAIASAGEGSMKACRTNSVAGVYLLYGDDNNELPIQNTFYSASDIGADGKIRVTIKSAALTNLFVNNQEQPGVWLPALFKVVFNIDSDGDGTPDGVSEGFFWISSEKVY